MERKDFKESLRQEASWLSGLSDSVLSLFAAARLRALTQASQKRTQFFIFPTDKEADHFFNDLTFWVGDPSRLVYLPDTGVFPYEDVSPAGWIPAFRVRAFHKMRSGESVIVSTSLKALLRKTVSSEYFTSLFKEIVRGVKIDHAELGRSLASSGYSRVSQVRSLGEFSVRGEIIDFFSPAHEAPVRLAFFDDEIEDIRVFDPETQRTTAQLETAWILPLREDHLPGNRMSEVVERMRSLRAKGPSSNEKGLEALEKKVSEFGSFPGMEHYLPYLFSSLASPWDYLSPNSDAFLWNPQEAEKIGGIFEREMTAVYTSRKEKVDLMAPPKDLAFDFETLFGKRKYRSIYPIRNDGGSEGIHFHTLPAVNFRGDIKAFLQEAKTALETGRKIFIFTTSPEQAARLGEVLVDIPKILITDRMEEIPVEPENGALMIVQAHLTAGFHLPEEKIQCLPDNELFGRKKRKHRSYLPDDPSRIIESFVDLKEDDYVVHINHGIGVYRGLVRLEVGGKSKDYLKIEYREKSNLFIPVEQVNLVQKYIGSQGKVSVDVLGGKGWDKVKQRVKKSVEDIAKGLIALYAKRRKEQKTPLPSDSHWQLEFENEFEFEETADQLRAVEEIKKDQESTKPMDRLVCGDVGFGKTEVAIRAIFKAVMATKQCAVLAPTTILSDQHEYNFKKRFANYPIRVEALNRFKSAAEQKQIIQDTAQGKVDVLIGTHRLLSKDVSFRELGLLVIDEEQKFGVKHKEKIREFAALVDTLTLSATPIPRTLHMSLVNIRDITVINTPPMDRQPVETYVTEWNEEILVNAVRREKERGGQIFFVHNRVETIASMAVYLRNLFPGIRIGVGHGQMEESELEEVMDRFIHGETDILLSTTIVDSGLDIPNANTIFVNQVEDFGLAQLYQLRGRVGRSSRQAYAYFFYRENRALSETAMKRLTSISEFVALGSGLKIAMRDLEIRGAGNILGSEQSGDVMAIGFELYCQLLDEAVHELLGDQKSKRTETLLDLKYHGFIPDSYVPDQKNKIEIYKKIAGVRSAEELSAVGEWLKDAYGEPPDVIHKLFAMSRLRVRAADLGIFSVVEKLGLEQIGKIEITLTAESRIDPGKLLAAMKKNRRIRLDPQNPLLLILDLPPPAETEEKSEDTVFHEKLEQVAALLETVAA